VRKLRGDGRAIRGLSMGESRSRKMAVSFHSCLFSHKERRELFFSSKQHFVNQAVCSPPLYNHRNPTSHTFLSHLAFWTSTPCQPQRVLYQPDTNLSLKLQVPRQPYGTDTEDALRVPNDVVWRSVSSALGIHVEMLQVHTKERMRAPVGRRSAY
jgi:hypothetical protein